MKCKCTPSSRQFPIEGSGFSRRNFLRVAGTSLVASYFADVVDPRLLLAQTSNASATLRNSAKSVIFIFLQGAPSQIDMWDLKEGAWTPSDLAPTSYGDVRWPQGLLPKTAEHLSKLTIVRSGLAWAAVHQLAQSWAQIVRNPGGATGAIAPHMGAVVSLESQAGRAVGDVLPGFIALNANQMPSAGYFPARYAPFSIPTDPAGVPTLTHGDGEARFRSRWALLHELDAARADGSRAKQSTDMGDYFDHAKVLMETPGINDIFAFTAEDRARYGNTTFGESLLVARNIVASKKGTRFVQVSLGGWDHHGNIYARDAANSLWAQCNEQFDPAFGTLLGDLSAMGLLDETLIVVLGEFGRTVGPLNSAGGRDHYLRQSFVFAGGGTRGGRAIGKTDAIGDKAVDYEWSANRDVRIEDVSATIYSTLGVDYTTLRNDDPLGRGFEYVPYAKDGLYHPIEEMF
ncbi:MAG TPA: DUF1501 domain-containing protein [Thermoanaerobaculia bacterium]|nr:DUF1501 domain-containing protein [Thermoanaerobaculia bacterium]